jgi:hypothetical protein
MVALSTDAANQPSMFSIRDAIRRGFMRYAKPSLARERRRKINCGQRFRLHRSMVPCSPDERRAHRARHMRRRMRAATSGNRPSDGAVRRARRSCGLRTANCGSVPFLPLNSRLKSGPRAGRSQARGGGRAATRLFLRVQSPEPCPDGPTFLLSSSSAPGRS